MEQPGPLTTTTDDEPLPGVANGVGSLQPCLVWVFPRHDLPIHWLGESQSTLGRESTCQVVLEGKTVSREHARIKRVGQVFVVEDLRSRNGVYVNAKRVETTVLVRDDILRVGEWVAVYRELPQRDAEPFVQIHDSLLCGPTLRPTLERAKVLARGALSVVLEGETGTGKEVLARYVHEASGRTGPFVAVNCAAYRAETAAAELFGYRRGAFTGAERAHIGHIAAGDGGTVFLDEIAELDLEVQAQVLRVLQEGELLRLGEASPVRVNVRFIAATQRPLAEWVSAGRFRADLRARLEGGVLRIPPLRERREEIVPLFRRFLEQSDEGLRPQLDPRLLEYLAGQDFPLNVREVRLLAQRLALLAEETTTWSLDALRAELPARSASVSEAPSLSPAAVRQESLNDERRRLLDAISRHRGNVTRAAAELNITRQRAYRLLKRGS